MRVNNTSEQEVVDFREKLFAWFKRNERDFPWRQTSDPYSILVAEKLLQQTSARQVVVDAFEILKERYPTPEQLAEASYEDLKEIIHSLGFHYRAQELIDAATVITSHHSGKVPTQREELLKLPGVGEYTTRAMLSFAYGQDVAVVDTNVARLLHRIFDLPDSVLKNPARNKLLHDLTTKLMPEGMSREFNFAILDLCALICVTTNPKCWKCPVLIHCEFGKSQAQAERQTV